MAYLTEFEIGSFLDITSVQVKQMKFPEREGGGYDVRECVSYYINILKEKKYSEIVDVGGLSELFGVSERRVQQYADEGMPRFGRGEYSLRECVQWMLKFQRDEIELLKNSGSSEMHNLKKEEMKIRNQQRLAMLNYSVGKYVSKEAVRIAWANEMHNIMKSFKGLVHVLDYSLENVTDRVERRTIVDAETDKILKQLSEIKIETEIRVEENELKMLNEDED